MPRCPACNLVKERAAFPWDRSKCNRATYCRQCMPLVKAWNRRLVDDNLSNKRGTRLPKGKVRVAIPHDLNS
jgi:hypothetical protein